MIGHKDFPSCSGGVEVMVGGLARSLVERGYDVTVYNRGLKKHHTATVDCLFCPATPRGFLFRCWRRCPLVHGVW